MAGSDIWGLCSTAADAVDWAWCSWTTLLLFARASTSLSFGLAASRVSSPHGRRALIVCCVASTSLHFYRNVLRHVPIAVDPAVVRLTQLADTLGIAVVALTVVFGKKARLNPRHWSPLFPGALALAALPSLASLASLASATAGSSLDDPRFVWPTRFVRGGLCLLGVLATRRRLARARREGRAIAGVDSMWFLVITTVAGLAFPTMVTVGASVLWKNTVLCWLWHGAAAESCRLAFEVEAQLLDREEEDGEDEEGGKEKARRRRARRARGKLEEEEEGERRGGGGGGRGGSGGRGRGGRDDRRGREKKQVGA